MFAEVETIQMTFDPDISYFRSRVELSPA